MFEANDAAYLSRQLGRANVVLFLGAGFSSRATNSLGFQLPLSAGLAAELWQLLECPELYDESPLDMVYGAVLAKGVPHARIRNFLEERLVCASISAEYDAIAVPLWYRIYTTNIDDLVQKVYIRANPGHLETLSFPADDITERDQSLDRIQLIHLNGRLPCAPTDVTFSPEQYGRAAGRHNPLYEQFVRDYSTHPTIFVGTKLSEPLFWQYLKAREDIDPRSAEQRPRSFLVTRQISPALRSTLERLNVVSVPGELNEFLTWLSTTGAALPTRRETLSMVSPGLAAILSSTAATALSKADQRDFGLSFSPVPTDRPGGGDRSLYLLGAAPRWEDILKDLDCPRSITPEIVQWVEAALSGSALSVGALLGSAGSGKSTIIRRLGLQLARSGRDVFLTNSETLPAPGVIRRFLEALGSRAVLLFDNAEVALSQLSAVLEKLDGLAYPPVIMIASRTNDFDRMSGGVPPGAQVKEFHLPHLDRGEIESLIALLAAHGLLGTLNGKSHAKQIAAFEAVARRQILIAMKEATLGPGFNQIMRDEFEHVTPAEAQSLYLCVALATEAGYRLTRDEVVGCSRVKPAESLNYLARNLKDVVVPSGPNDDLLLLRHRLIAEEVIERVAPRPLLRDAYIRLLTTLAPFVRRGHWRSRIAGLYRAIANHKTIYRRFRGDIDEARAIFTAMVPLLDRDADFWLQYGSLELEGRGGSLVLAENYLRQAESLNAGDRRIQNALGHLLIRKGREVTDRSEAEHLRNEGVEVLMRNVDSSRYEDAYAIHILGVQRYKWAQKWLSENDEEKRNELGRVKDLLETGVKANPFHRRLKRLLDVLKRAELQMVIPRDRRPVDPPLPEEE